MIVMKKPTPKQQQLLAKLLKQKGVTLDDLLPRDIGGNLPTPTRASMSGLISTLLSMDDKITH